MRYLNGADITILGTNWLEAIDVIEKCTALCRENEFSQPVKPYLRYNDPRNRIIAMPAYVGGDFAAAGIKWIASFPGNKIKAMPRAHSVLILNDASTGKPRAVFNTAILSGIRTAAVSGSVIRRYLSEASLTGQPFNAGIIGLGQIGQLHLEMLFSLFGSQVRTALVYDSSPDVILKLPAGLRDRITVCSDWETVFDLSDVFITCTVAEKRYINREPRRPSLHLNVSLRDYYPSFLKHVDVMLVDSWAEVCRENTDIEAMHKEYGLAETDVRTMADFLSAEHEPIGSEKVVMFNPMGMAVFDIAVGSYFLDRALRQNVGTDLDD